MNIKKTSAVLFFFSIIFEIVTATVPIQQSILVGDRVAEFIPEGFNQKQTPSLMLKEEPTAKGKIPTNWLLFPEFSLTDNKASATLKIPNDVSLYGGGEVTGPLLRNGQLTKLWNTDTGAYSVEGGKRLYQTHPWVMGVRKDGTAFGILFDSSWKAELQTNSDAITYKSEGTLFRVFVIDRESPQAVLKGLAELIGTMQMPARWTLGYHQCRFSYTSEKRVREIAETFRSKKIPCDVIWMDIDYMDGYRVFTFDKTNFPDPTSLNNDLHKKGFHSVYMIDPGVKVDKDYTVYQSGTKENVWVKRNDNTDYQGKVWPGYSVFPDFTQPKVRDWWAGLYKEFLNKGVDGVWNDMNEPSVFDDDIPSNLRTGTMPLDNRHTGGGTLPAGSHLLYHNAYGRLMVEASNKGILEANPNKRPFLLTRANLLGGQRYAATWTGDNLACTEHLKLSVPMSITLGLSGQPFSGPDIGGFLGNTSGDLWANWLGFGVFLPFVRGHACAGTNDKEPWAYGEDIEKTSRIALERRYRLLPYIYTLFYQSHKTGLPVMIPVFFSDPKNLKLRAEQEAFLLGDNLLVIPSFSTNPTLPAGIWETLSLVDGDMNDKYQATLKIKGGSIIPIGKIIQNTNEQSFDPLTLMVCLNEKGTGEGKLFVDNGDGWGFKNGDYSLLKFTAKKVGNTIEVQLKNKEGRRKTEKDIDKINVEVLLNGKVYKASGTIKSIIKVKIGN